MIVHTCLPLLVTDHYLITTHRRSLVLCSSLQSLRVFKSKWPSAIWHRFCPPIWGFVKCLRSSNFWGFSWEQELQGITSHCLRWQFGNSFEQRMSLSWQFGKSFEQRMSLRYSTSLMKNQEKQGKLCIPCVFWCVGLEFVCPLAWQWCRCDMTVTVTDMSLPSTRCF